MPDLLVSNQNNNERFLLQVKTNDYTDESNYWIKKDDLNYLMICARFILLVFLMVLAFYVSCMLLKLAEKLGIKFVSYFPVRCLMNRRINQAAIRRIMKQIIRGLTMAAKPKNHPITHRIKPTRDIPNVTANICMISSIFKC